VFGRLIFAPAGRHEGDRGKDGDDREGFFSYFLLQSRLAAKGSPALRAIPGRHF
jgi:hypothetical protein